MFDGGKQRGEKKKFAKGMKKYFSLYANARPSLGVLANTQARYSADLRAAFFFFFSRDVSVYILCLCFGSFIAVVAILSV